MKRTVIAAVCLIAAACEDTQAPNPFAGLDIHIDGVIESDTQLIDAGTNPIPAGAGSVQFVARVMAPPGTWQLSASAEGSFALAAADGGSVIRPFQSTDKLTPSVLRFAIMITNPFGIGVVHTSVGPVTRDFEFPVQAISSDTSSVCIDDADGGCLAESGSADAATVIDGGVEKVALPPAGTSLVQGERVLLRVRPAMHPIVAGESWPCSITATGAIALAVDGGFASAETVQVTSTVPPLRLYLLDFPRYS